MKRTLAISLIVLALVTFGAPASAFHLGRPGSHGCQNVIGTDGRVVGTICR